MVHEEDQYSYVCKILSRIFVYCTQTDLKAGPWSLVINIFKRGLKEGSGVSFIMMLFPSKLSVRFFQWWIHV